MSSAQRLSSRKGPGASGLRLEGVPAFGAIWLGQVFSLFGSHLTGFALGVWVFQETRSATDFSLISFFSIVPEIALAPLAGVVVDRWSKRTVLLVSTAGAGVCASVLVFLAATGQLRLWEIYLIVSVTSALQSLEFPALSSSITLLVPRRHLSRANGMVELSTSLAMVAAPLVAGLLLATLGLNRVLALNVIASVIGVCGLAAVRIPRPDRAVEEGIAKQGKLRLFAAEAAFGWRYISRRRELFALLLLFAASNFIVGMVEVLLPPLVLSFASAEVLGIVLSTGGVGVVLGSILVSVWRGPERRIPLILGLNLLRAVVLFLGVLQPRAELIGAAAFVFLFCDPLISTCSQTIWQTKVPVDLQGRVFAFRRMAALSSLPLAYLLAGPLADQVFEPLMKVQGLLASTAGALIGTGPGRGVALMFVAMGVIGLLSVSAAFRYRPLRYLEDRLPDVAATKEAVRA